MTFSAHERKLIARLTPLPGGLLAWDAAPLMALLTAADLEQLLAGVAAGGRRAQVPARGVGHAAGAHWHHRLLPRWRDR